MMTPTMIKDYENAHGAKAACDLLELIGPDGFDGDYSTTLICLEQIEMDEKNITQKRKQQQYAESTTWKAVWAYNVGASMGRIAKCREMLEQLEMGYQDRVKMGLHYV